MLFVSLLCAKQLATRHALVQAISLAHVRVCDKYYAPIKLSSSTFLYRARTAHHKRTLPPPNPRLMLRSFFLPLLKTLNVPLHRRPGLFAYVKYMGPKILSFPL